MIKAKNNKSFKVLRFKDEETWLEARRGKVTGTRLGSLFSKRDKKPLKAFFEIIAERVAIPPTEEGVMDRGKRLEEEAIERFTKETGKKVNMDLVIWCRADNEDIAISPDGTISDTEAIEAKCLNSASHIEAWLTKEIPSEYEYQVLQYFCVNDNLKKLYFVFYDPRLPRIEYFYIIVERKGLEEKIAEYLELQKEALARIAEIEKQIISF